VSHLTKLRGQSSKLADARLTTISETISGIRIVKFMNWEVPFLHRIAQMRARELAVFRSTFITRSIQVFTGLYLPVVVSFIVFALAYRVFSFEIDPVSVFPAQAMLNVLRMPLFMLPLAISKAVDMSVGVDRIRDFLIAPEQRPIASLPHAEMASGAAVEMRNVTIVYEISAPRAAAAVTGGLLSDHEPVKDEEGRLLLMSGVNLWFPQGKLTAVIGPTGCGKSTLARVIVGEAMTTEGSRLGVRGTIAYVPQEPWIMNGSLRQNILLDQPFDEAKYLSAVAVSQLIPDLRELDSSDQTEIGERGVNLSGGQKQRVALARAVYSDRDIVVMDDPLSAVDSHVCVAIFEKCIMGALRSKTRVLVTHQTQFLPSADHIIVLDRCRVMFQGSYDELLRSTLDVTAIMRHGSSPESTREADGTKEVTDGADSTTSAVRPADEPANEIPAPRSAVVKTLMSREAQASSSLSLGIIAFYIRLQGWALVSVTMLLFACWRIASVVAELMIAWWSGRNEVIGHTLSQNQYLLWYGIFTALTGFFLVLRQIPFVSAMMNVARTSHHSMVQRLLRAPTWFFDTTPAGRVMSRFSKDIEQMDLAFPESMVFFYNLLFRILGVYAMMAISAPYIVIVIVALLALFILLLIYYTATNRQQKRLEAVNRSPIVAVLGETVGGLVTLRAYNAIGMFSAKFSSGVSRSARSLYSWRVSQRWLSVRTDAITSLTVASMGIITTGLMISYSAEKRQQNYSLISLGIMNSLTVGGALSFFVQMIADMENGFSSIERVKEYCEELPQEANATYDEHRPKPPASWPAHGHIEIQDLSLRYRDGLPLVLEKVNLDVQPGWKVGIVGRTGSGKSSMMLALFRIVEAASGRILIDGVDAKDVAMDDLRCKITIIPQDPLLFRGSVRYNIDPFEQSTDEEVWEALKKVGLEERVQRDGQGLGCDVEDKGANFSVGQRQLLCLARALLRNSRILLLDEATASVDAESDALIHRILREEFRAATVLTIAHRLATIADADRVCVLDRGHVAEYDAPHTLLQDSESQFFGMVAALGPAMMQEISDVAMRHVAAHDSQ
jgi:ABC-type multidrug transport system fused ATPase/permease subunit